MQASHLPSHISRPISHISHLIARVSRLISPVSRSLCCILFLSSQVSIGQSLFSSPYSVYGIGLMNTRMSTLNRSMGGAGIAVRDEFNLNHLNPASYTSIVSPISHIYEAGFYVESNRYTTARKTESSSNGGLTNLNYWFKFSPKWATTIGLTPFSSVSYMINTEKETGASTTSNYLFEGSGNISQLYMGNSVQLVKNLSLGVNVSYLFGSIYKNESLEPNNGSESLTLENKIFTNTFDFDFGLQYRVKLKNKSLILGVVADDGLSFKGKEKLTLFDENGDTLTKMSGNSLTYKLPEGLGLGLALQTRRSIVASDLKFKKWSDAHFGNQDITFKDTWTYALGYSYKGNPDAETYLGLASLRAGFYVQSYHLILKDNTLPNWGLSAGLSLPVFDNKSAINLTYAFDRLGKVQDGLVLQNSQKFMVDIVIRDLWGMKRKFD